MIYKKLLEFQKLGITLKNDGSNPAFKSSYSTINEVLDKVRKPLSDLGVVIVQKPSADGLATVLHDTEDETSVECFLPFVDASNPQKLGGNITYNRRYSLVTLLGLEDEDDDGNAASDPAPAAQGYASHPDGERITIFVQELKKGLTKNGSPYLALKTEQGKVMVWKQSGLLESFAKGATYDVDIANGAVSRIYEEQQ